MLNELDSHHEAASVTDRSRLRGGSVGRSAERERTSAKRRAEPRAAERRRGRGRPAVSRLSSRGCVHNGAAPPQKSQRGSTHKPHIASATLQIQQQFKQSTFLSGTAVQIQSCRLFKRDGKKAIWKLKFSEPEIVRSIYLRDHSCWVSI